MSEPIPESIPTSQDPRSKRPTKRLALTPTSQQAQSITTLFARPDRLPPILSTSNPSNPSNPTKSTHLLPPPPEIVANVQGSSAGAGSGEFHVYKASRRREYERIRLMEEEVQREDADREFERRREEMRRGDEKRTEKKRRKRERGRKGKGKGGKGKGKEGEGEMGEMGEGKEGKGDGEDREGNSVPVPVLMVDAGKGVIIHDEDDDDDENDEVND